MLDDVSQQEGCASIRRRTACKGREERTGALISVLEQARQLTMVHTSSRRLEVNIDFEVTVIDLTIQLLIVVKGYGHCRPRAARSPTRRLARGSAQQQQ